MPIEMDPISGNIETATFIKLMLPSGVSFSKNGITLTLDEVIEGVLDQVDDSQELALAMLFEMLESDHLQSETIGKYSYTRWAMKGSVYWRLQAASAQLDTGSAVPNVQLRGPSCRSC